MTRRQQCEADLHVLFTRCSWCLLSPTARTFSEASSWIQVSLPHSSCR